MNKYELRHKILELLENRYQRDFPNDIEPEDGTMQQYEIEGILEGVNPSEINNQLLYLVLVRDLNYDEPLPNEVYYFITEKGRVSFSDKIHLNEKKKVFEDKFRFWFPTAISLAAILLSLYSIIFHN